MTETTARGWPVRQYGDSDLTPLSYVQGSVLAGDVHTILDFLCRRYERLVEPIVRTDSWGHSYRSVRGYAATWSEHSAGTAVDLNAPAHWIGLRGTFTDGQVRGIRQLLAECGGVVVWGGDWKSRPDEMHFEVRNDPAEIKRIAGLIREQASGTATAEPVKAQNTIGTRQGASIVQWLNDHGQDASFAARATLAAQHGIEGYRGTAEQNLKLLSILRSGTTGKRYTATTDVNRRIAPPAADGKLAEVSRFGDLPAGMAWTGTGRTQTDVRGHVWIEGRSDWMISTGQDAEWINGTHLKEV